MTAAVCRAQQTATVTVLGPAGAGVRTFVESASDIDRLPTAVGPTRARPPFQIGRLDVGDELVVRLLALSPDEEHRSLWPALAADAFGMIVVLDGAHIETGFPSLDLVERAGLPYGVVLNRFGGRLDHTIDEFRAAMDLEQRVALADADGRDRVQAQMALLTAVDGLFGWS